jgi:(1->4)-alpha-D-glucan 1-alpha-D-glucosylmutase
MPDEWGREVSRWMRLNRSHRTIVDGEPAPDRNDEYRYYQALVGRVAARSAAGGAVGARRLVARMRGT